MNVLSAEGLSKSYDEKLLFEGLTFGLDQGQKAALVGVNGCGKSTLLRVISGQESPDDGQVSFRKNLKIGMLRQHPQFDPEESILEAVFADDQEELRVIRDYQWAISQSEKNPHAAADLPTILEKMDRLNAWDYEHQIKELLGKLGIDDLSQKMGEISGGQRRRIALAQALVTQPNLLILDEPTNHLDIEIIEWLENYLATQNLTILMVTHDRYFLDKVTSEILEMDQGKIFRYKGNYSHFLEKKAERESMETATVDKAKNLLKTELEWMRRQPKARGTKAKYRVDAFYDLKEKAHQSSAKGEMEVNLQGSRQGKKILELKDVNIAFNQVSYLKDFSYVFKRGDRVGIVGKNGVGKSTFLNLLTDELTPDSGTIDKGQTTKMGYYKQSEAVFKEGKKVIEIVSEVAEYIKLADGKEVSASALLTQFLFPPKTQHSFVDKLSGGEKRRLQLLRVLMSNPNFLILDEPTNDFDIVTLNVLEDYLSRFTGCLMVVSHDRYFMDRLVDHLFVFEGQGRIRDFPGNYSDFRNSGSSYSDDAPIAKEVAVNKKAPKTESKRLSFKEKHELETIEKELPELEKKKSLLEEQLLNEADYQKLEELGRELEKIREDLELKEIRWLELSELD